MMNSRTLYDKLWDAHVVRDNGDGTHLIYIDRHLAHEVTSPQAFEGLALAGRKLWRRAAGAGRCTRGDDRWPASAATDSAEFASMPEQNSNHDENTPTLIP